MDIVRIASSTHKFFKTFCTLYADSFPLHEQRTAEQQQEALNDNRYRLLAFADNGRFVGFVACWLFPDYAYVEHFAVEKQDRGNGVGSTIMKMFAREVDRTVILEIDPVCDEITTRRMNFYVRCGFKINPYSHTHPPYRSGYTAHKLTIMSWPHAIDSNIYSIFADDLRKVVMKSAADL